MSGSPQPVACKSGGSIARSESYRILQGPGKAAATSGFWKSQEIDADTVEATASGGLAGEGGRLTLPPKTTGTLCRA